MSEGIVQGRLGRAERAALRASAAASNFERRIRALESALSAKSALVATDALKATTLLTSMTVASGKTVDGRDLSVDGAALDALGASVTGLTTVLANRNKIYVPAPAFENRDARTIGYSNNRVFIQATDAANSRYYTTLLIPNDIESGSSLTVRVHWLVAGAGGTNGQDVVWRVEYAFTQNAELTSTGGGSTDATIDCPDVTAETSYRSLITSSISGAAAGDLMTLNIHRRGSDVSDTLTATLGFVGVQLEYTVDTTP